MLVGGVVLLCFIWLLMQLWKVAFGVVTPSTDYAALMREVVASNQPASSQNAWPIYAEAMGIAADVAKARLEEINELAEPNTGADMFWDYSRMLHGPPDPARWTLEREQIRLLQAQGVFAMMVKAASIERAVCEPPTPDPDFGNVLLFGTLDADLSGASEINDALTGCMRLASTESDWAVHSQMFDAALAGPQMLAAQGISVEYGKAMRMLRIPLDELQFELLEGVIEAGKLTALDNILAKRTLWLTQYSTVVEVERLLMLDAVQHWYTDNGFGVGFASLSQIPSAVAGSISGVTEISSIEPPSVWDRLRDLRAITLPSRRATVADIEKWTTTWSTVCAGPPERWSELAAGADDDWQESLDNNEVFALMVSVSHARTLAQCIDAIRHVRVVRLMLAIETYRAAHDGAWPESLNELGDVDADILIDPESGQRFRYERITPEMRADEAGESRPYLLFAHSTEGGSSPPEALNAIRPE